MSLGCSRCFNHNPNFYCLYIFIWFIITAVKHLYFLSEYPQRNIMSSLDWPIPVTLRFIFLDPTMTTDNIFHLVCSLFRKEMSRLNIVCVCVFVIELLLIVWIYLYRSWYLNYFYIDVVAKTYLLVLLIFYIFVID